MIGRKKRLLDECAMVVVRCHDTWDRMPEYGIPDAWAACLGFETEDRPVESFYKICRVPSLSLAETARAVLEKVRSAWPGHRAPARRRQPQGNQAGGGHRCDHRICRRCAISMPTPSSQPTMG